MNRFLVEWVEVYLDNSDSLKSMIVDAETEDEAIEKADYLSPLSKETYERTDFFATWLRKLPCPTHATFEQCSECNTTEEAA